MNQKEAVYQAVTSKCEGFSDDGESFEVTKDERTAINQVVFEGLKDGSVDLSDEATAKHDTDAKLKSYTSGLVSNWLRKDKRLNGDVKYTPKNPGSRTGQGDPQIKELRKLLKIHLGTNKEAEIQGFIDTRVGQLKAEKAKTVEIDIDQIPEELRDLVSGE